MNINIQHTNMEMTPAISDYIEKRARSLGKLIDIDGDHVFVRVEVGVARNNQKSGSDLFRAEFEVKDAGAQYYADAGKDDLYAAIDEARDDILRQLRKEKGKRTSAVRRGGARMKKIFRRFNPF